MRKTGTITINDKVITINELTTRQILAAKDGFGNGSIIDNLRELLPLVTDASEEFLMDLAPSELKALFEKVKEVNADFFDLFPLDKILVGYQSVMMETVMKHLSGLSVSSLVPGMDQAHGNTAGDSSTDV